MQRVQAQDAGLDNRAPARVIHFDLPAQPLAAALEAYGNLTRLSVLAQSSLLDDRVSASVSGDYSAADALQRLLVGTGLTARFTDADEALIVSLAAVPQLSVPTPPATIAASAIDGVLANGDNRLYAAMIQTRVTEALCASPETRPGSYRLVVRLSIDGTGAVVMSSVVGSTGSPARDESIRQVTLALAMDGAPPPMLKQPVTILIRPNGNGVNTDCAQFGERG